MDTPPMFNSVEDECRYWKERAKLYHKEWTDVKQEYDEYVEQSRQMEAEMDATLDQKHSIIKDLRMKLTYSEQENESFKLKRDLDAMELSKLTKQLENAQNERDSMKDYLRQLEQKNDDLERAHRILNESIVDFERMLDKAYEKNALLEMEVDEKEMLQEKLQRLMDETRDLKQELNVKARYVPNGTANNSLTNSVTIPNGTATATELNGDVSLMNSITGAATAANNTNAITTSKRDCNHHSIKTPENLLNGNAMQASSRTTALNIVADMLRKLNLDKALICRHCRKFRCVCVIDDAAKDEHLHRCIASNSVDVCHKCKSLSATNHDTPPNTPSANILHSNNITQHSDVECRNCNNFNLGTTNMFKRFALRKSGNVDL